MADRERTWHSAPTRLAEDDDAFPKVKRGSERASSIYSEDGTASLVKLTLHLPLMPLSASASATTFHRNPNPNNDRLKVQDEMEEDSHQTIAGDAPLLLQHLDTIPDIKELASWKWPTHNKWFSGLEGIWRTADTTDLTGGGGSSDPAHQRLVRLASPFEVTTTVTWENKDLMPDVLVSVRSPYLVSLLCPRMPDSLADALCCQEPEIDAKDLFFLRPTLRQIHAHIDGSLHLDLPATTTQAADADGGDKEEIFWTGLHLRHLLRFLDEHFVDASAKFQWMNADGLVSYEMLWAFLSPGTEVRFPSPLTGTPQHGVVVSRGTYVCKKYEPDGFYFKLKLKVMDYDGESYHPCTVKQRIQEFDGDVPFRSLPVCPLSVFSCAEQQSLEALFRERGRLFYDYAVQDPFRYMQYTGTMTFYEKKKLCNGFEMRMVNADGRVMVDLLGTARAHPDWPLRNAQPPPELLRGPHDISTTKNGVRVQKATEEPSEEELKGAPAGVFGFSFTLKQWGCFDVTGLTDVSFNDLAYEQLVMQNAKQKEILRAIVSAKLARPEKNGGGEDESALVAVADHNNSRGSGGRGRDVDVVAEKGKGCVVLCYGPPGTGKTLTAEALAESLHRPLWRISAFELGDEAAQVEKNLGQALKMASRWRAVVLLDEADGYLERRENNGDIRRNLVTGVFLRLLEYHDGVLFLTTNRVRSFDTAILSRVSFRIQYAALGDEQCRSIWRTLLKRAGAAGWWAEGKWEEEMEGLLGERSCDSGRRRRLNGREIRNVVALAKTWAAAQGEAALTVGHVRDALDLFLAGAHHLHNT